METVPENSIPGLSDSVVKIREDVKSGVENLTEECVSTMAAVTRLLMKAWARAYLLGGIGLEPTCLCGLRLIISLAQFFFGA
uniref:Uncharacterized protein n=1 Tax=Cucumis melo TaxID=3656 RepID=A0A9I9EDV1_CUCME